MHTQAESWGLGPLQTAVWTWVLVLRRFLTLAKSVPPLRLGFLIRETRSGAGEANLWDSIAGKHRAPPRGHGRSGVEVMDSPASSSPVWTRSQPPSGSFGLTRPYPGPPHPGGAVQSQGVHKERARIWGRRKIEAQKGVK